MPVLTTYDLPLEQALYAVRTPLGVSFATFFTSFGSATIIVCICLLALWILHSGKRWEYALGLIAAVGGAAAVGFVIKELVGRVRPPLYMHAVVEKSPSFPSLHSTAAMALYGFLAITAVHYVGKKWQLPFQLLCAALILAVGFSRLYLGVHYLTDVLGGFVLGAFFVWFGTALARSFDDLIARFRR